MPSKKPLTEEQKEKRREYNRKQYYVRFNTPEKKEERKKYRKKNRDSKKENYNLVRRLQYQRFKEEKPYYSLMCSIRSLVSGSIRKNGFKKNSKTETILGCTIKEFIVHLESQFEPWMNWDNYGNWNGIPTERNKAWDMDHIIPTSSANSEDELLKLNHHSNIRPLCSYVNRYIKRDNLDHF